MRKGTFLLIIFFPLAAAMLLLTASCGGDNKALETHKEKQFKETPVEVSLPSRAVMEETLNLTATAYSDDRVPVYSETTGIVEDKPAEESSYVHKGQVLVHLKRQELELALRLTQSTLDKAEADFKRSGKLFEDHLISQDTHDQSRYAYEQARISRDQAKVELAKATILAPINGVVAERLIRRGDLVKPQQQLFTVIDLTAIKASLFVPEKKIGEVEVGSVVRVSSDAFPGQVFSGSVERIAPVADSNTGTFKVTVALKNSNNRLRPGMFLSTSVVLYTHPNALVIPKKCLVYENEKTSVFVVKGGKAHQVQVKPGLTNLMSVEIVKGLTPSEKVVTVGQSGLKEGVPVKVLPKGKGSGTALDG